MSNSNLFPLIVLMLYNLIALANADFGAYRLRMPNGCSGVSRLLLEISCDDPIGRKMCRVEGGSCQGSLCCSQFLMPMASKDKDVTAFIDYGAPPEFESRGGNHRGLLAGGGLSQHLHSHRHLVRGGGIIARHRH